MDDDTFFEEADNDDCPMENPFRGSEQERPEDSQAIFELGFGNRFDFPVESSGIPELIHFSVWFDNDPFSDEAVLMMTLLEDDGTYHTGFLLEKDMKTIDCSNLEHRIDDWLYQDNCEDFTFVFTAETRERADDNMFDLKLMVEVDGIAVLNANLDSMYEDQIDDTRF